MDNKLQAVIDRGINKGLGFLAKTQKKDGSFMCLVSTKLDNYRQAKTVPAIVPTNIVLSSLITHKSALSEKIKKRAADFLIAEKGEYWSFNYWFKKSDWFRKEPYPDDLDDTFCALAALYEYKPSLFNGEVMAKIVTMLASAEKQEGGPYDMWLVPESGRKTWNDTDLVVNSNIAYFLSLQDIFLKNVNAFIEEKIENAGYEFPYNKIYPGIYFISRFYKGKQIKTMIDLLISNQEKDGKWENPLRTALAISALINLSGYEHKKALEKGIKYLAASQAKNGSWPPASFYFQMRTKKKTLYAGSASTTTALCLEALNKWKHTQRKETSQKNTGQANEIYKSVIKMVKNRFSACGSDLKALAIKTIVKTVKSDKDGQIGLLPYFFRSSMGKIGKNISDNLIVQLGAANMFGWIAYTIYDDFLDDEGDPKLISVANVSLRESSEIFGKILPKESKFGEFSKKIFDAVDSANAWEIINCRNNVPDYGLPGQGDYSQLAMKSFGHCLGPMAIIFAIGYGENSAEVKNLTQFFKHYLIARQLNDDAHDWEDDLKKGHINAIGAELLKDENLGKNLREYNLDKLRKLFWEESVVGACRDIIRHAELARGYLNKLSTMKNRAMFLNLLRTIEKSAEKALEERAETLKFIKNYKPR